MNEKRILLYPLYTPPGHGKSLRRSHARLRFTHYEQGASSNPKNKHVLISRVGSRLINDDDVDDRRTAARSGRYE